MRGGGQEGDGGAGEGAGVHRGALHTPRGPARHFRPFSAQKAPLEKEISLPACRPRLTGAASLTSSLQKETCFYSFLFLINTRQPVSGKALSASEWVNSF